uniref:Uncharacterized protein n=1 Tax=Arundo donax TaxID=35708 RepID=A0A0A8Y569_ARUDO
MVLQSYATHSSECTTEQKHVLNYSTNKVF